MTLYHDLVNSITRNTQLLYILHFAPIDYLDQISPRSFQKVIIIAVHMNCTKGHMILTEETFSDVVPVRR